MSTTKDESDGEMSQSPMVMRAGAFVLMDCLHVDAQRHLSLPIPLLGIMTQLCLLPKTA
jgi:hypothetical protein